MKAHSLIPTEEKSASRAVEKQAFWVSKARFGPGGLAQVIRDGTFQEFRQV